MESHDLNFREQFRMLNNNSGKIIWIPSRNQYTYHVEHWIVNVKVDDAMIPQREFQKPKTTKTPINNAKNVQLFNEFEFASWINLFFDVIKSFVCL